MGDIDFSLILPSRERVDLLARLLESVAETTARPERIEVWVAVDWDDRDTMQSIPGLVRRFPWLTAFVMDRQNNFSEGYYNKLARACRGRFIQVLNDDVRFITPDWDRLAVEVLEEWRRSHPDGIVYGRTFDDLGTGYSCFPLLTREAINAMSWVFHPENTCWGADIHLHDVYSRVDRVLDLPYHFIHDRQDDEVHRRMGQISGYNLGSAVGESMRLRDMLNGWK